MSEPDYDVAVIGGGPAGSLLAALLARAGRSVLVFERDRHPRDHVGESLTPSCNVVFQRVGVLEAIEAHGFVRKPGAAWTGPNTKLGRFVELRLAEAPLANAPRPYAFNVERSSFDALLLRHARSCGAEVWENTRAEEVLFDGGRATGVRGRLPDSSERTVGARFVVDASGRRCLLGSQLGLKRMDSELRQVATYSWFRGVTPPSTSLEGMLFLHFLGLERGWAWQIPLRDAVWSVGVVTDKSDYTASRDPEQLLRTLASRNATLRAALADATAIRPFRTEGDYSYSITRLAGPGWLVVGDALRFIDPVFSTGVDVAAFSALRAFETMDVVFRGGDEAQSLGAYDRVMTDGVGVWYEFVSLFYRLQNIFTFFVMKPAYRARVIRVLQGNPYLPDTQRDAMELVSVMKAAEERVATQSDNLLKPWALSAPGGRSQDM